MVYCSLEDKIEESEVLPTRIRFQEALPTFNAVISFNGLDPFGSNLHFKAYVPLAIEPFVGLTILSIWSTTPLAQLLFPAPGL